jgi:hypothetical protein
MLALICAYLCAPHGFRRILRWVALCVFLVIQATVLMLFWRVLTTAPKHHGRDFHPRSHQSTPPDFILPSLGHQYHPVKGGL